MSTNNEKFRLKQIEDRLKSARNTLEGIIPIWTQVDKKLKSLETEIRVLEDERLKIIHGQTTFAFDENDF